MSQGFSTGQAGKAAPASLTKSPANAPCGIQPALQGCKLCPGAYSSPAPPCQGAFHRRHQCACVPRWPGLTASFIAANYWQQRCRGDGAWKMGYHLPGRNDVRLCGLQRQPQLPTGGGGNQPTAPHPASLHTHPLHPTAGCCKSYCRESCIPELWHGSGGAKVMPIGGDSETFPHGWEWRQRGAAGSRPHSVAAECSEASHCEKNEQIIGFSVSSKDAQARPRCCAAPWEVLPGRSFTLPAGAAATGMLPAAEQPPACKWGPRT